MDPGVGEPRGPWSGAEPSPCRAAPRTASGGCTARGPVRAPGSSPSPPLPVPRGYAPDPLVGPGGPRPQAPDGLIPRKPPRSSPSPLLLHQRQKPSLRAEDRHRAPARVLLRNLQADAVGEQLGSAVVDVPAGERGRRGLGDRHDCQLFLELVEGLRRVQPVRADAGAAQRGQMAADAKPRAEVAGEGADVGAGGADDRDDQVEDRCAVLGDGLADVVHGERGHRDRAGGDVEVLALPRALVGAHPVDLDGADLGRHLHDVAGQGGDPGVDGLAGDP